MEHLYVCEFSNGFIKVGITSTPERRMQQHAAHADCMGVSLVRHCTFACATSDDQREQGLINRCVAAATARHQLEWFRGLSFETVCEWAADAASADLYIEFSNKWAALIAELRATGMTQWDIARAVQCGQTSISKLVVGRCNEPLHSLGERLIVLHARKCRSNVNPRGESAAVVHADSLFFSPEVVVVTGGTPL